MGFTKKEQGSLDALNENLAGLKDGEAIKAKLEAMPREELKAFIGQTTLNEMENQKQKADDQDLQEKIKAKKSAEAKYKDVTKANKAVIEYAKYLLEGQGVVGVSETTVND